jgi:lipoprotein-anchoring transpeptidase ErfK/SrfK
MKSSAMETRSARSDLMRYSFYSSGRRNVPVLAPKVKHRKHRIILPLLVLLVLFGAGAYALKPADKNSSAVTTKAKPVASAAKTVKPNLSSSNNSAANATAAAAATSTNYCAGNTLSDYIQVSISLRHLWACEGSSTVYNSPVVTGIEYLAADQTPVGTYKIYGKYTDTYLKGSDSTGSWDDYVNYWMPFLNNQYGSYGLHDATWRPTTAFGNIDPDSANASHGCVELPLGTAAWLYNWAPIGTTVTIVS